jgi:hypothetical protein
MFLPEKAVEGMGQVVLELVDRSPIVTLGVLVKALDDGVLIT